jgi:hypothetical protein
MADKLDVKQGTLALMILKTLEGLGPLHGYGIARRIEETSKNRLALNYGTLYPGTAQARAGRVHQGRVAAIREQPTREVLCAHRERAEAACARNPRMARDRDLIAAFLAPKREAP